MLNQQLLRETESRPITTIVNQCQLQLYGQVSRYQNLILFVRLFLKEITRGGEGQGDDHKVRGWAKSMLAVGSDLVWEGDLQGDLHRVITGVGVGGLAPLGVCPQ